MYVGSGSSFVVLVFFCSSFCFVESIRHPVGSMCFYDLVVVIFFLVLLYIEKIFILYFYDIICDLFVLSEFWCCKTRVMEVSVWNCTNVSL
jgi:hypothetical protein